MTKGPIGIKAAKQSIQNGYGLEIKNALEVEK